MILVVGFYCICYLFKKYPKHVFVSTEINSTNDGPVLLFKIGPETIFSHYGWQGRTGQDMDLENWAIFFKFQCYAGKNQQKNYYG